MTVRSARLGRAATPLSVAIAVAFAGLSLGAQATTITSSRAGETRVLLPSGVFHPGEPGVEMLHDYGAFQLYRLDAAHRVELESVDGGAHAALSNKIEFNAEPLDALVGTVSAPSALQTSTKAAGSTLQIVQFIGPTADEWLDAVRATGAVVLQYIPSNAYIVRADQKAVAALAAMARRGDAVQFTSDYSPYLKLDTRLGQRARAGLSAGNELLVTVQVVGGFDNSETRKRVARLGLATVGDWFKVKVGDAIRLRIKESAIADLAKIEDVFAVEEYHLPHKMDERQDQIIAGNLNVALSGPSGPGYVAWLTGQGFPTTAASYPTVDVSDDGVGTGVAASAAGDVVLRVAGLAANASRLLLVNNCTTDTAGDGVAGHGHINTTIVGGYDARAGFPYVDPLGYQRGVGVNPFVNLTHTKIFANSGDFNISNCSNSNAGLIKKEQNGGAYISSNSWGSSSAGAYDTDAQDYDLATRDADSTAGGNQPMVFVFAAGNDGPSASTVGSPGTAKNVITVGASENIRPSDEDGNWTDGCQTGPTGADNAMDVIDFSSRGPASSARKKPEVIAPGTHIQGSASTVGPTYDGSGVCDKYRPSGQTTFAASSGTSHSTPATAGAASLYAYYLKNHFQTTNANYASTGVWPSAAAIKAYMMAHTTYLTGVDGHDTLPSNNQGFGMPNLQRSFDSTTQRYVNDQQNVLAGTGATFTWSGGVADTTKPLKIAMAFSDAPGATTGSPVVNNLDLSVTVGGNTYKGNVFNGQYSVTGGSADAVDSYEAVMLPPGTVGDITITVTAANIAGDGVPGNGDTTDQDFALVCSNCTQQPDFNVSATTTSFLVCAGTPATVGASVAGINGFSGNVTLGTAGLPAGASLGFTPTSVSPPGTSSGTLNTTGVAGGSYSFNLTGTNGATTHNSNAIALTVSAGVASVATLSAPVNNTYGVSISPTLSWTAAAGAQSYIVEIDDDPAFGSINYTATVAGTSHVPTSALNGNTRYYWRVKAHNACGDTVSAVYSFVTNQQACQTVVSTDVPKTISASGTPTVTSTVASTLAGTIGDLDVVNLRGQHTYINDLSFSLAVNSTPVTTVGIMARSCNSEANFFLSLDDAAAGTAGGWPCPPVNSSPYPANTYRPSSPLSAFNGKNGTATWTLTVKDNANQDGGSLDGWGLRMCTASSAPNIVDATNDSYTVAQGGVLTVAAAGVLGNDLPSTGLTSTTTVVPAHGTLSLNANGSFVYTPSPAYCGSDSFTYQASNGTNNDTATASITVTCTSGNTPPLAVNDSYGIAEDGVLTRTAATGVLINDTDADSNPLTAVLVSTVAHGTLALSADGSFTYTPTADYNGADSFTYKANDGAADSIVATVNLSVTAANDAPTATADTMLVNQGGTRNVLVGGATSVLTNDSDIDGDTVTASVVTNPAHGTLTLNADGTFLYTHDGSAGTSDSFVYKACDAAPLCSANTTVSITVNLKPVAGCTVSPQVLKEGDVVSIALAGLFTDPEATAMSFGATGTPAGLSVNPGTGLLSGTVSAGAATGSPYTLAITATDAGGASFTRNLVITVLAMSDTLFRSGFEDPASVASCH